MSQTLYHIEPKGKRVLKKDEFFLDYQGCIRRDAFYFERIYKAERKNILIYYSEIKNLDVITYYGVSVKVHDGLIVPPSEKQVSEELKFFLENGSYSVVSFEDTLNYKSVYRNNIVNEKDEDHSYNHVMQDEIKHSEKREKNERDNAEKERNEREKKQSTETRKSKLKYASAIERWLKRITFSDFYDEIAARVRGQADLKVFLANVYNYLDNIANGRPCNNNTILCAPSGSGKTETYRALKDYFSSYLPKMPIAQVDMTSITEEGFSGKNTVEIVRTLLESSDTEGVGIIFMDEFDKKIIPSYSKGGSDVNAAVQSQILTLVEGREVSESRMSINTNNTMFVALGSFDVCRKEKVHNAKHSLGFCDIAEEKVEHYSPIVRQDIIDLGGSYELIGRFPLLLNYKPLSHKVVDEIIDMKIAKLEESYNCNIHITKKMRDKMHDYANSEYGCRSFDSVLQENLLPAYAAMLQNNYERREYKIVLEENRYIIRSINNKAKIRERNEVR